DGDTGCSRCAALDDAELATDVVADRVGEHVEGAALGRLLGLLHLSGVLGVGGQVEELHRQAHTAYAVGDRVVHLGEEGGPVSLQALDDRELPQGAGPVEGVLVDEGGEVEELALGPGRGAGHAAAATAPLPR